MQSVIGKIQIVGRPHMSKVLMPVADVGAVAVTPIGQGHTPLLCIKIILAVPRDDLLSLRCGVGSR